MNEESKKVAHLEAALAELQGQNHALKDQLAKERDSNTSREEQATRQALEEANEELRDLTENLDRIVRRRTQALMESEEQLRKRNLELKRMNQTKREFVSIAAHEMRTPLTSMVGYLELVAEGRFGEIESRMERPMSSVRRNAQRLCRLVDEMLDVSRIEEERVVLRIEKADLSEICQDVAEELQPLAEMRSQDLRLELETSLFASVDVDKIHQVLVNLLGNAIRYCPEEGSIVLSSDVAPESEFAGHWARLRVRDNGPGIRPEDVEGIFEPFSDIHPAKHHTSEGPAASGLGLYIARGLVDCHEGILTVDSELGAHTEFSVLLPIDRN